MSFGLKSSLKIILFFQERKNSLFLRTLAVGGVGHCVAGNEWCFVAENKDNNIS